MTPILRFVENKKNLAIKKTENTKREREESEGIILLNLGNSDSAVGFPVELLVHLWGSTGIKARASSKVCRRASKSYGRGHWGGAVLLWW